MDQNNRFPSITHTDARKPRVPFGLVWAGVLLGCFTLGAFIIAPMIRASSPEPRVAQSPLVSPPQRIASAPSQPTSVGNPTTSTNPNSLKSEIETSPPVAHREEAPVTPRSSVRAAARTAEAAETVTPRVHKRAVQHVSVLRTVRIARSTPSRSEDNEDTPPRTKSSSEAPRLLGEWSGRHTHNPASLSITHQDGRQFGGIMTVHRGEGTVHVIVAGTVSRDGRTVTLDETGVTKDTGRRMWDAGTNSGQLEGKDALAGTGRDSRGRGYSWSFHR